MQRRAPCRPDRVRRLLRGPTSLARTDQPASLAYSSRLCRCLRAGTLLALTGAGLLAVSAAASAAPATPEACSRLTIDAERLACYDAIFRAGQMPADISSSAAGGAPPTPAPNRSAGTSSAREALTTPAVASSDDDSPLSTFWELGPSNRRGTFVLRIYRPNYVLPLHVTSDIGTPASPSHPAEPATVPYRRVEAKLQISLRAKVAEDVFHSGGDLWFAYTQRSLWQLWNPDQSSPFRSNDYQPEGIFLLPVPERWRVLPGDWRWRFAQLGLAHQSNGQGGSLSRSWNRIDLGTAIERGAFALQLRMHERVFRSRRRDDNPDIVEQLGRYELQATWAHGLAIASATWRTNLRTLSGRSLQLDWTYPVLRDQPDGLRWYVQLYTGTGETLIDYNHEQTSLGLGVSLFRF